jgi:hypothetical protein
VVVGGQMVMRLPRLYGSPTVVVWSKGMYGCRAKTAGGAGAFPRGTFGWVYCSLTIAVGSAGMFSSRAKVCIGGVMLVRRRKFAYRYVMIGIGCSVDYCGLFTLYTCAYISITAYCKLRICQQSLFRFSRLCVHLLFMLRYQS